MEQDKKDGKNERKNISNLPEERLNLLRPSKKDDEDSLLGGFSPQKAAKGGQIKKRHNFFAAWDDTD